jgi:co-chaperonin GroES (HSP10)
MALSDKIKVVGDRLLIEQQENEKTSSGIIIPDSA